MNGGMPVLAADCREWCMLGEPRLPRPGESDSRSWSSACFVRVLLSLKDNVSFLDPSLLLLLLLE